jgi:hypothetical protein
MTARLCPRGVGNPTLCSSWQSQGRSPVLGMIRAGGRSARGGKTAGPQRPRPAGPREGSSKLRGGIRTSLPQIANRAEIRGEGGAGDGAFQQNCAMAACRCRADAAARIAGVQANSGLVHRACARTAWRSRILRAAPEGALVNLACKARIEVLPWLGNSAGWGRFVHLPHAWGRAGSVEWAFSTGMGAVYERTIFFLRVFLPEPRFMRAHHFLPKRRSMPPSRACRRVSRPKELPALHKSPREIYSTRARGRIFSLNGLRGKGGKRRPIAICGRRRDGCRREGTSGLTTPS